MVFRAKLLHQGRCIRTGRANALVFAQVAMIRYLVRQQGQGQSTVQGYNRNILSKWILASCGAPALPLPMILLSAAYSFDTNLGLFRIGLQGAWVREYEVKVPDSSGGVTVIDAVGQYNNTNPVARPLPEFKVNTSLNWSLGSHRAFLLVRHVDGYKFGTLGGAQDFWRATVGLALGSSAASKFYTNDIDSWTTADVQYTYSFPEISWVSSSSITVGVKNFTNEEPPWVPDITGYDPITHDARGRIWFIRFGGSL